MPNGHLRRDSNPILQHAPVAIKPRRSHDRLLNSRPESQQTRVWRFKPTTDAPWFRGIPDKARSLFFSAEDLTATDSPSRARTSSAQSPKIVGRTSPSQKRRSWSSAALRSPSIPLNPRVSRRISPRTRLSRLITPMADSQNPETFLDESSVDPDRDDKRRSRSRRPSFRKTLSLITDSRRTSTDGPTSPLSPTFGQKRRSFSFSRRISTPAVEQAQSQPQPPSQYYQDPEARMKLRMVLASPQNFDQALEHGFPSSMVQDTPDAVPQVPSPLKLQPSPVIKTRPKNEAQTLVMERSFFDDSDDDDEDDKDDSDNDDDNDNHGESQDASNNNNNTKHSATSKKRATVRRRSSFDDADGYGDHDAEDGDNDEWSATDVDSPITPSDTAGNALEESTVQAGLSSNPAPVASPLQTWDDGSLWSGNREMTLRMTLTKPELRATEEQLYGWQQPGPGRADPLALEALPAMRAHSALGKKPRVDQETGKVRGLWRKVRPGSRG